MDNQFEYKSFFDTRMEIKADGGDGYGSLEGYAAVFGNRDRVGDIIVKGAFKDAIPDFLKQGVILARHGFDSNQPIAYLTGLKEDDYGLWYSGNYHSTPFAQQERAIAQERLAAKKEVGNSIMYMAWPGDTQAYEYTQDGRVLKHLFLGEITTNTTLAANPKATLAGVKDALGGPLAGLTLAEHSDATLAVVRGYLERVRGLEELRLREIEAGERKEGRVLSAAIRSKLEGLLTELEKVDALQDVIREVLDMAAPKEATKSVLFDARRARAQLLELEGFLASQGVKLGG